MSSYLGPHLNLIANQDWFFAKAKPRISKLLVNGADPERLRDLARLSRSTIWIGRIVLNDQNLQSPAQSGRELGERIIEAARIYPDIDLWEGYNEVSFTRYQDEQDPTRRQALFQQAAYEMAAFAEHEIARTLTLHGAKPKLKSLVGGFPMGVPELDLMPFFYPALRLADGWHTHEYGPRSMRDMFDAQTQKGWLCGRFARFFEAMPPECRKTWYGTEVGVDAGNFRGWKCFMDAAAYMRDLIWFDQLMAFYANRYPIGGAMPFGWLGRTTQWDKFDIDGALAELLCNYIVSTRPAKIVTLWRGVIDLLNRFAKNPVLP